MTQFSVSWGAHKQNICGGLSLLQQNGEFVDMTLAADGHHVKVHKMVMSLASPYIKDIVANTEGLHPVLFLNKVSFKTLCALLEYIYTGEVMVSQENLSSLVEAGKELHINGLKDMKVELAKGVPSQSLRVENNAGQPLSDTGFFDSNTKLEEKSVTKITRSNDDSKYRSTFAQDPDLPILDDDLTDHHTADDMTDVEMNTSVVSHKGKAPETQIQYTLSTQGALQMILNRFIYYLRYTSRKGAAGHRQWRCIDYVSRPGRTTKCPAVVITAQDVVVKRIAVHNHPFHDEKILKKVRDNSIFTALTEAERHGESMKQLKQKENNK